MPTQTQPELTPDEITVLTIANDPQYRTTTGNRIRWAAAIKEHPEFKDAVAYKSGDNNKGVYIIKNLRSRGIITLPAASGETAAPPSMAKPISLTPSQEMCLKIARKYTLENGTIAWKKAFEKFPEAVPLLVGKKCGMQVAYQTVNLLRRRNLLPTPGKPVPPATNSHAPTAPPPPDPEMLARMEMMRAKKELNRQVAEKLELVLSSAHFCPRCGKDLEQQLRLALLEAKLMA